MFFKTKSWYFIVFLTKQLLCLFKNSIFLKVGSYSLLAHEHCSCHYAQRFRYMQDTLFSISFLALETFPALPAESVFSLQTDQEFLVSASQYRKVYSLPYRVLLPAVKTVAKRLSHCLLYQKIKGKNLICIYENAVEGIKPILLNTAQQSKRVHAYS